MGDIVGYHEEEVLVIPRDSDSVRNDPSGGSAENDTPAGGRKRPRPPRRAFSEHRTFLSIVADDLTQIPTAEVNPTSAALKVCQQKVVKPFKVFLKVVGWVPVFSAIGSCSKCMNILYPLVVIAIILFGYIIQWAGCFCRFIANAGWAVEPASILNDTDFGNATVFPTVSVYSCLPYIISRFIIINLLHCLAYVYSFYTLRIAEPEHLESLMERVFLFTKKLQNSIKEEARLITNLRRMLFGGVVWVLLSLLANTMHVISQYDHLYFSWLHPNGDLGRSVLVVLLVISLAFLDVVYMVVVYNYTVECRLIGSLIDGLVCKLNENTIRLFDAMENCGVICQEIWLLNRNSSIAVSIVLINFVSIVFLGVMSITESLEPGGLTVLMYVSTVLSVLLWVTLIAVPVFAAAMLTSRCAHLRNMGLLVRLRTPLEYDTQPPSIQSEPWVGPSAVPNSPLEDRLTPIKIDSFIQFMSSLNLTAKLFLLPVRSGYVLSLGLVACLTVLICFQLGKIHVWL